MFDTDSVENHLGHAVDWVDITKRLLSIFVVWRPVHEGNARHAKQGVEWVGVVARPIWDTASFVVLAVGRIEWLMYTHPQL